MAEPGGIPDSRMTESIKLACDAFKHVSTLNAGSIVLIGTFLQGIFPSKNGILTVGPEIKMLTAASLVFFGLSLVLSVINMYRYTSLLERYLYSRLDLERDARVVEQGNVLRGVTLSLFALGLLLFGFAAAANILR